MATLKIVLFIIAILLWVASFIVRRKNRTAGVILSWSAAGLAALVFILNIWG